MTKKSISLEVDPTILEKNMRFITETPMEQQFNNFASSVEPYPVRYVKPDPGLCLKTFSKRDNKKIFVNICKTNAIPCPQNITNEELMTILSSTDPSSYRVPMSIGEGRTELDKSGAPVTVYDVAINDEFFKKIEKDELFRTFLITVIFEGLQDKYQIESDLQKITLMKNRKSMGTLQTHRIQIRDVQGYQSPAITSSPTPLIEEVKEAPIAKIKEEAVYRLRREPKTGEIEMLVAEIKIPNVVPLGALNLEMNKDRLVLDCQEHFNQLDISLPCSINMDTTSANLDRNGDILIVKMPVIQ